MGSIQRFKYNRPVTILPNTGQPPYYRYTLKNMRQIATQLGSGTAGSGIKTIFQAFVPAGSWAQGKAVMIRGIWRMVQLLPSGPPAYNIAETVDIQTNVLGVPGDPGPFVPSIGTATRYIERVFIRQDPDILFFDRGINMENSFANQATTADLVGTLPASGGSFDYTLNFPIDLNFNLTTIYAGMTFTGVWMEAFLEQGTNLGTLS